MKQNFLDNNALFLETSHNIYLNNSSYYQKHISYNNITLRV